MPAQIPNKTHFLYQPIQWTYKVWQQLVQSRGNAAEVHRLFNLLPVIEAHMEDKIGLQLSRSIVQDITDTLQDRFVKTQIDNWRTEKTTQLPSVLQQLCILPAQSFNCTSSNFYSPLQSYIEQDTPDIDFANLLEMMSQANTNQVSASTQTNGTNSFNVDMIDLDNLELIIQEQQQRDSETQVLDEEASTPLTQNAVATNMHVFRIEVKRIFKTPEKTSETFKRFFIALKKVDPHAAIRPVYANDANRLPSISSPTQVQNPELLDISKYHKSWTPNQRYGLSGQLLIESSYDFNELSNLLYPWLNTAYYQLALSECQTSELVTIGVFIRASYTICRNDLAVSTKSIIASLDKESQFDFSFRADNWFFSGGKVNVIFVAVARDRLKQGMDYFCNMYNGENKKVPNGIMLLFVPLYQIQLTPEMRDRIGQEQRSWQDSEIACFVQGFKDLSTVLTLKDGSKCTLRSLLLRFPNHHSSIRPALFHGVDRRPESVDWITLKYHRDDNEIFKRKAPGIAYELAQMVADDEVQKIFINPEVGLNFGGEWRHSFSANTKSGRRANPTPSDPALLTHFHSVLGKLQPVIVKRPVATPVAQRLSTPIDSTVQTSYASRAASTTITSMTQINNTGGRHTPLSHQTRSESVVVIEQYEARFVHVESRLTSVEKSVSKSGSMLEKLLRHNGIDLSDDEDNSSSNGGAMEVENQNQLTMEGSTKRICSHRRNTSQLNQNVLSPLANKNFNHA